MNLIDKIKNGKRLGFDEALLLYEMDLFELGHIANNIRQKFNGKKVYFNVNRHINPTNLCADVCQFCAFSSHRKNEYAYTMSHEEIMQIVDETVARGTKEIHIVSAHNPNVSWQWYLEIFKKIKQKYPFLHIKAMTAAEVDYLHRKYGFSYEEVLDKMIEYGVDSMPGGGAEIFDEEVRKKICKTKVSSQDWLNIHRLWHKKGRESNATMLFGHIEDRIHRIDHIFRIRDLQDEALKNEKGGFNAFIPLVYQRENNYLKIDDYLGAEEILKTVAISRILLDNIKHIKAYWATMSLKLAMVAQEFGCDDLDGTIEKESIQSSAGANSRNGESIKDFIDLIKSSNLIPVQRDSLYNEIKTY
ncbi:aminofutalosine synthase MqnE [Campylobacter sp. RM12327]|uniref:aminofutalosine synthase MqnE n=1 Tax=Campylobacter sputorum TaxID=206 RepID=UPI000B7858E5|nr:MULTISPECIES: aminofutalosine synthase MqnE [Campylobacter]ASM39822.1 menaquinone biosynthesis protein, SCO4494 family [Campylobacter sputorum]MBE7358873.1 aminofutalosine synthase MqnE [Campylobacter sp. RM11302]MBF6670164.1 aminofutalosine synthase MqnE [Campylobacter sp. RM12327]MBF6675308.1 aminofutalosine synthase MqnE [Campylobacter sp. RM13538]MBF6676949.1 aminofutalosine synthase MqnE [Campylobacter sp. RM12321]